MLIFEDLQESDNLLAIAVDDADRRASIEAILSGITEIRRLDRTSADRPFGLAVVDEANLAKVPEIRSSGTHAVQLLCLGSAGSSSEKIDFILPGDVDERTLGSVLLSAYRFRNSVAEIRRDAINRRSAIGAIKAGEFAIRTLAEARALATMLAVACPNPDLVAMGLQELFINAIEHGNLEIDGWTKQRLIETGNWENEIEKRLADPVFSSREAIVKFARGGRSICFTIHDEGPGFDFEAVLSRGASEAGYHGRGIAIAREIAFTSVTYLDPGNVVIAMLATAD